MRISIVIDTREQQPWSFSDIAETSRGTLRAGDYALKNDTGFAVERKSLDDFTGTLSSGWPAFCRELDRMAEDLYPARVIIVEGAWMDIVSHRYNHPEVKPPFILKRLAELTMDGVSVLFCDNPTAAAGLCWRILYERHLQMERLENATDNHSDA